MEAMQYITVKNKHHPESYALIVNDNHLAPHVKNGDTILVEPEYPEPNELGVIWAKGKPDGVHYVISAYFKPIHTGEGSNFQAIIPMAQINPHKRFAVIGNQIDKLHRVVGIVSKKGKVKKIKPYSIPILPKAKEAVS